MRHRWYAGGIATLLSGALMFTGYMPAMAADDTSGTGSTSSTPTPSPSPSDTASAAPTDTPTPTPSPSQTTAPKTKTLTQQSVQAPVVNAPVAGCPAGWPVAGSPVAGFEIDGNLCQNDTNNKDWSSVGNQPVANDGFSDSTEFTSGAKESNWPWSSGQTTGSGTAPGKTDIGNVYAYTQTVGGDVYAYLGFERQVNNGSVAYHVELNQKANSPANSPVPNRTAGDLRLTINQNGNNTISLVGADKWNGTAWVSLGNLSGFIGQVNQDTVTNLSSDSLAAGTFAEAAIDLTTIFGGQGCSGNYGVLNVRSSASPEDTSSLGDWIKPVALNVPSTCSTITILKKDAGTGALLPGANFTITPNPATGTGSTTGTTDANGQIVFNGNVLPGTYTITETQAPAGYLMPSTVSQQVTVGEAESKTVTFNDPLGTVVFQKKDADGNLLGGATFQITATGGAAAAAPWNLNTNPITVVDNTGQAGYSGTDTDAAAGKFKVANLPIGSYSVKETAAPAGYVAVPGTQAFSVTQQSPNATISSAFVNSPVLVCAANTFYSVSGNGTLRKIASGVVSTIGQWSNANDANGLAINKDGSVVYAMQRTGSGISGILRYTQATGTWETIAGTTGLSIPNDDRQLVAGAVNLATGNYLFGGFDGSGATLTFKVYSYNPTANAISYLGFIDTGLSPSSTSNGDMAFDASGNLYVVRSGSNANIFTVTAANLAAASGGKLTSTATNSTALGLSDVNGMAFDVNGSVFLGNSTTVNRYDSNGWTQIGSTITSSLTDSTDLASCNSPSTLTLKKNIVARAGASDQFTVSVTDGQTTVASATTTGSSTGVQSAQVGPIPVVITNTYGITETAASGSLSDYATTWSCDNGQSGTGTTGSVTIPAQNGISVTCTFTNAPKPVVQVIKKWVNGVGGDTTNVSLNQGASSIANGSSTVSGTTIHNQSDTVITTRVGQGTQLSVSETLGGSNVGQYNTTYSCVDSGSQASLGSNSFTVPAAGATCTVTNTDKTATVNVYKHWRDAIAGDTADLSVGGGGQSGTHHSTAAGGNNDDATPATITVPIGTSITVGETLGAANQGSYSSTLDCGAAGTSGKFTLTADTSCVYTNSNGKINITLKKNWVTPVSGDSADLQINGVTGATSPAANGLDNTNIAQASVLIGSTVSVGEVLHGIGAYTTSYTCTPNVGNPWSNTTFQVPLGVSSIACVVTNTVKTANVVVKKSWVGGIANDTTNVSLNQGGSSLMSGSSTVTTTGSPQTDQVVSLAVAQNTSVNVTESLGAGNKASYNTTYSCVVTGTATALDPTGFAVPAAGATCVVTNTAKTVTVNLNKKWVHGANGDSTSLKIAPAAGEGSTVTGTSTVTVPDETDAVGIDTITTAVTSGGTANLSEVLNPANFAAYGQALSCDGGTLSSGTLTVPKAGGTVTCTFTNTVAQTKITLQKNWQGGVNGDKATLTLTGATNAVSTYNGTNGVDAAHTTSVTVNQGTTVTVNELLAGSGTYDKTVDCGNGSGPLGSGLQVLVGQSAITCTITNTAASGNVTLVKKWVNSISGDSTTLGITAEGTTANATATTAGGDVTSAQQATKKVTAGASVSLGESTPGPKGSYSPSWSCDNGVTLGAGNTFTMPVASVTCTVVNTNKLVDVTLHKAWVNSQTGDQALIKLSQDGPGTASGSATATAPNDNPVSLSVPWGATVTTGETLAAGNHASYNATTLCSNQASSQTDVVSFTATGASVDCTITNSATQATVHLYKNWVGSVKGDSTMLSVTGGHNASNHTSVSTGGDDMDGTAATADAYTGQTVGLNETTVAGSGFLYDTSLACFNGQTPLTVTNGQITIPANATDITCTFTNTLKVGKLTLVKALDINWGGTAQASAWTLTADGPGGAQVQGTTGVSKTVPVGTYALTEGPDMPGYHLESIVCTNGDANVPVVNGSINLASGANVVCTYTNTDEPALLTLHKIVDETAAGGSVTPDQFTLMATPIIPPTPAGTLPVFGNGADGVEGVSIPAGQYTLSESGPAGFLAGTWTCVGGSVSATDPANHTATLTVDVGQTASCSITNTAIQPKLTLVKVVDNGDFNGAGRVQDWTLTAAGSGLPTVTGQGGSSSIVEQGVKVGTYNLSEEATGGKFRTEGYSLTSLVCSNGETSLQSPTVTLHEGDDVTCTFTNTPTPAKWTISKTSDKGLAVMPGDTIHYTLTVTHVAGTSWPAPQLGLSIPNVDDLSPLAAHATFVPGSLLASFGTPVITANELSWSAGDLTNLVQKGSFTISYAFTVNAGAWGITLPNALTPPNDTFSCVGDNDCTTLSETPDVDIWKTSEVTKDPNPADASSVLPGGQVTYTLNAENITDVPLEAGQTETDDLSAVLTHGATLVTPLPAGLVFDGDHTLTWTLPAIAAGDAVSISFIVQVGTQAGPYDIVNTMVPGTIGHCPPEVTLEALAPEGASCTTTNHVPNIDLGITKTFLLAEGQTAVDDDPGTTSAYTYGLKVTNNSDTAVSNATVTDTLPDQITLDTTKGTGGFDDIPSGWHPTYDSATNKVTITIDSFAVGGSGSITLHVQVKPVVLTGPVADPGTSGPTPVTYPTTIDNTACVSVALDTNADNNCSTVKVPQKTINANIYVQCLADVPYLHYDITATNVDPSLPVTLTWTANQPGVGGVPSTDLPPDPAVITRTLHVGDKGQILWPGGAVTPDNVGIGFPGWRPIVESDLNPDGTLKNPSAVTFEGLIYDPSTVATDAWRYESTVTIHINPTQTVTVSYPPASAACAVARPTDLTITKTASVQSTAPGGSFTYNMAVKNVNLGAASPVTVTDKIPADLKITGITTSTTAFPRWKDCAVTGQDSSGYGGTLTCSLFGPLKLNESAPTITLAASVSPTTKAGSITNTGVLTWTNTDNPNDKGSAESSVTVTLPQPLAVTGGSLMLGLLPFGMLVILGGTGLLLITRRRKHGDKEPQV